MRDQRSRGRSQLSLLAITAIAALATCAVLASGAQAAKNPVVGAAYTETNDPGGNEVVAFDRKKKGQLKFRERISTGGLGSVQNVGCGANCPILDSQYATAYSAEGFVFAVNAGSDTITSFVDNAVVKDKGGLKRRSEVSSGGDMPESLAVSPTDNVVYVLNVNTANSDGTTGNIHGFRYDEKGKLSPIDGSSQPLPSASPPEPPASPPGMAATARGISFDPKGKTLATSELAGNNGGPAPGTIVTFKVSGNGVASPAVVSPSARPFPFGARFDGDGDLIVPNIEDPAANTASPPREGTVTTYSVAGNGSVTPIETENTNGVLPCWVAITPDLEYVYVTNTGAGPPPSLSEFQHGGNGNLSLFGELETPSDFALTDTEVSVDGKFLYVLSPNVGNPSAAPSHVDWYKIKGNGALQEKGSSKSNANLGEGATGLAVI